MAGNEPNLLEMACSLLGLDGEGEEIVCPDCSNKSARVIFTCPCGTTINVCAACMMVREIAAGEASDPLRWLKEHFHTCDQFRSLVEHAQDKEAH
jgi:hypothetical protein